MIHLTKKKSNYTLEIVINTELTIQSIAKAEKPKNQAELRWLSVWFDKKLSFRRHITERAAKARKIAWHIHSLARIVHGPPASSLRKAVITCILLVLIYGVEA